MSDRQLAVLFFWVLVVFLVSLENLMERHPIWDKPRNNRARMALCLGATMGAVVGMVVFA